MNTISRSLLISHLLFALALVATCPVYAQDSTVAKLKPRISMKYFNDNGQKRVDFRVYTREDRTKVPVEFAVVNLYLNENSTMGMLGNITTDENGEGSVPLDKKFGMLTDTLGSVTFIGSLMNDPRLEEAQSELPIQMAIMEMSAYEEDSLRFVKLEVLQKGDSGAWRPAPELEIGMYVQRFFSLLPISEYPVYTDEDGQAVFEFPSGLKGDSLGNLTIVSKIDAHEDFGTIISKADQKWGVPVTDKVSDERLLSGSRKNAPLSLTIIAVTIIVGIWGFIGYIVVQLFRIRTKGKSKSIQHEKID